jgi:meso-butanediol dehydrogenase/(S,S)-butanediol dehydrogenase/diacetyl reductase
MDSTATRLDFESPWQHTQPLQGKTALVTGAGRGIGRGVAQEVAAAGAFVIAADLDGDAATATAAELDLPAEALRLDVASPESVTTAFERLASLRRPVDLLVNVAGILSVSPVASLPVEDWDRIMDVNARGVFLVCRAALPEMIERRSGTIVNISSVSGKSGEPTLAHYSASKFAVIGFTQSLAKEVAEFGIRVNAICPGVVETQMINDVAAAWGQSPEHIAANLQLIKRPQQAREIGAAVVFLALMPSITGQALNVDGGTVFN